MPNINVNSNSVHVFTTSLIAEYGSYKKFHLNNYICPMTDNNLQKPYNPDEASTTPHLVFSLNNVNYRLIQVIHAIEIRKSGNDWQYRFLNTDNSYYAWFYTDYYRLSNYLPDDRALQNEYYYNVPTTTTTKGPNGDTSYGYGTTTEFGYSIWPGLNMERSNTSYPSTGYEVTTSYYSGTGAGQFHDGKYSTGFLGLGKGAYREWGWNTRGSFRLESFGDENWRSFTPYKGWENFGGRIPRFIGNPPNVYDFALIKKSNWHSVHFETTWLYSSKVWYSGPWYAIKKHKVWEGPDWSGDDPDCFWDGHINDYIGVYDTKTSWDSRSVYLIMSYIDAEGVSRTVYAEDSVTERDTFEGTNSSTDCHISFNTFDYYGGKEYEDYNCFDISKTDVQKIEFYI